MGKIVNALKIARGDVAEMVLRSLEGPDDGGQDNGSAPATTKLEEPPVGHVRPLPRRISDDQWQNRAGAAPAVEAGTRATEAPDPTTRIEPAVRERPGVRVRPLLRRLSGSAPLLSATPEQPYAAEQYKIVRTRILQHPSAPSVMVISSPSIGDGKTVTAVNLAAAFAVKTEDQVLLVDADLRCSAVHAYLGVPRTPGLAEVLAGTCSLDDAMFRVGQIPGLCVLPAGEHSGNPSELLGSRWLALVKTMRERFRHVIVDCPPVDAVADYDLIAAACDSVILIVRPNYTNRTLCLTALEKVRKKLHGVLVNGAEERALSNKYLSKYHAQSSNGNGKE